MKCAFIYLMAIGFILGACCKVSLPAIQVEILDANGNNVLTNASSSDSTWKWHDQHQNEVSDLQIVSTGTGPHLLVWTPGLVSGKDYYIHLSNTDIDTMNIVYDVKGWNCPKKIKVERIRYNGIDFEGGKKNAIVRITKY